MNIWRRRERIENASSGWTHCSREEENLAWGHAIDDVSRELIAFAWIYSVRPLASLVKHTGRSFRTSDCRFETTFDSCHEETTDWFAVFASYHQKARRKKVNDWWMTSLIILPSQRLWSRVSFSSRDRRLLGLLPGVQSLARNDVYIV